MSLRSLTERSASADLYDGKLHRKQLLAIVGVGQLNDPSQLPPFSMPSKLLILHGEAKF